MRGTLVFAAALVLVATDASGQELVATRPGVMCHSADALGRLTLPSGDSRTHAPTRKPEDMALAASGGCIDIPPGARVTVHQAFHNTSIVSYDGAADGSPYVVPNIDFQPSGPASTTETAVSPATGAAAPPGYAVVQRLALAGSGSDTLVLLEDRRLTSRVREELWGKGDVDIALDEHDLLVAEVKRHPLLNARLQLLSSAGAVVAETRTEHPLAKVQVAPIHGLPAPAVVFTVDESVGMGGFNGPSTTLLSPATRQLAPVQSVSEANGKASDIQLASTMHTGWRIVPARHGGPEEIESAYCPGGTEQQVLSLETYRFHDGQWHREERQGGTCEDLEKMPPRSAFP